MTKHDLKKNIFAALLFVCACMPVTDRRQVPDTDMVTYPRVRVDSETEIFSKAEHMFRLKSYDEALEFYREYLSSFPDGPSAPAAIMREGTIHTILGQHEIARGRYHHLIEKYPNSFPIQDARVEILATYYNEGRYQEVIRRSDAIAKHITSLENVIRVYVLMGDAHMSSGSELNAVHFYTKAYEISEYPEKENIVGRLRQTAAQLSTDDILLLLKRLESRRVRGYLMYRLGMNYFDENKHDDAVRVLSEFTVQFPDHELNAEARQQLDKLSQLSDYRPHTVGCLLPLSGTYHIYGKRALSGIELALAATGESNSSVNLIIKDTASDPDKAVQALRELIQEGAAAVIGPITTAEAVASQAQALGIPIVILTQKERITTTGNYVFRNFLTPKMQVEAIVSHALESLGVNRFAVLYPDEKYGATFMTLFESEVTYRGGQVVAAESYSPKQTDFGRVIRKLARHYYRRAGDGGFRAIFIPDSPKKAGLIIPQLAYNNINGVQLLGTNLWHSDKLIHMARKNIQGAILPDVFFAESISPEVREFVRHFQEKFGKKPGFIEAMAYDTAMILFRMAKRSDIRTRSRLRSELAGLSHFRGVTGLTAFDESGEAQKKLYLLRIEGNHFVEQR